MFNEIDILAGKENVHRGSKRKFHKLPVVFDRVFVLEIYDDKSKRFSCANEAQARTRLKPTLIPPFNQLQCGAGPETEGFTGVKPLRNWKRGGNTFQLIKSGRQSHKIQSVFMQRRGAYRECTGRADRHAGHDWKQGIVLWWWGSG